MYMLYLRKLGPDIYSILHLNIVNVRPLATEVNPVAEGGDRASGGGGNSSRNNGWMY